GFGDGGAATHRAQEGELRDGDLPAGPARLRASRVLARRVSPHLQAHEPPRRPPGAHDPGPVGARHAGSPAVQGVSESFFGRVPTISKKTPWRAFRRVTRKMSPPKVMSRTGRTSRSFGARASTTAARTSVETRNTPSSGLPQPHAAPNRSLPVGSTVPSQPPSMAPVKIPMLASTLWMAR